MSGRVPEVVKQGLAGPLDIGSRSEESLIRAMGDFLGGDAREAIGAWGSALHSALLGRLAVARVNVLGASPSYADPIRDAGNLGSGILAAMTTSRSPRLIALVAAAGVALMALMAVAPLATAASTKFVTVPGKVHVAVGESVKVRMATNPSTGYSWKTTITGDKSAIKLSKGVYKSPAETGLVGAPGVTEWTITGKAVGKDKITFASIPPGGGSAAFDAALTVTVP